MNLFKERIEEVSSFFSNKDTFLGYRKLLDCVADTQNMDIYQQAIDLTDWKEKNPDNTEVFIKKAMQLLDVVSAVKINIQDPNQQILKATEICKSYGSKKFGLGPINLTLNKGEVVGLVGENGNGKTTLLRILAKELAPTTGQLHYNFTHTYKNEYDLRTKLVYIPQRTEKWFGSLMDNLRFVLSNYNVNPTEIEPRVLLMIARLGLWNYKHLKWSELSSGYKMRFELARTLLRKPEILLLDEPLANLDVLAQQVILEDLKSISNSLVNPIALILSSQQLYEVEKVSDNVIFLKNGKYNANEINVNPEDADLIIEMDANTNRQVLLNIFKEYNLKKLTFNGGIYLAYFNKTTSFSDVITAIGNSKIEVIYIRNISTSTRRFFVN